MHLQGCLIQKIGFVIRVPFENSARGGTTGPAAPVFPAYQFFRDKIQKKYSCQNWPKMSPQIV